MKILRDSETFKIKLTPYKIHSKDLKGRTKKNFQFTALLPSFLVDYFKIVEYNEENESYDKRNLFIYEIDNKTYITTMKVFNEINYNSTIYKDTFINTKNKAEFTTAYKMTKSNSYRFTLPNKLFNEKIDTSKDNYLLFSIDVLRKDFLNNYGVVEMNIIQK